MRALRVVGLDHEGALVCECTERGERFTLPVDDKLRAAARGELARVEPTKTELEKPMRPREIQARIRAGESVEQVAAVAGMAPEKVDRFAYPVLLERSRTAELAQQAHPVRQDGPDARTLGEVVAGTFAQRGQDYSAAVWDSWRGDDGKWIIQLQWQAGRSENRAHWTYHPGAHGGTVTTLDDLALDLIDPEAGISLRTVRPVTPLAEQALRAEEPPRRVERAERPERAERTERVEHPERERIERTERAERAERTEPTERERIERPERTDHAERAERADHERIERAERAERAERTARTERPEHERRAERAEAKPEQLPLDESAGSEPEAAPEPEVQKATGTTESSPNRRGKRNHPIVPSWEDVLLGVRSNR
jgi:hypothetical protein